MRILVVDDEPIEREALRILVQRYLPEMEVVGEARSGREAVELAEGLRPDVVLMDIEMPGMSGLEALREIQAVHRSVRCLIVSAYDSFHFAQEALRLGAADYLLKPVKQDQMIAVLRRLQQETAAERQRRREELAYKEHLGQYRQLAEAELVELIERGQLGNQVPGLLELLGIDFEQSVCMVIGPGHAMPDADWEQVYRYLDRVAHLLGRVALGPFRPGPVTLLVELSGPPDEYRYRLWAVDLARRLRERTREQLQASLQVGIGQVCDGRQGWVRSCQEAVAAYHSAGASGRVVHFGDLQVQGAPEPGGGPQPAVGAPEPGGDEAGVAWRPTPTALRVVEQGKQYIEQHYAAEITLERIAGQFSLTPYYYGKLFSRVVGQTVTDYLTQVRTREAKRLLQDPEISIKEACFAVGYADPNYFSRVFKKVTGQSPSEFRLGIWASE